MEAKTLLVVLVLQLSLVALGRAAERCAQPGALRCEEGRHQSVCLERSRVWHRVSDCAAAGGVCAGGRCVGGGDQRAAGVKCESKCSKDCTGIDLCLSNNEVVQIKCGTGLLCDDSDGVKCVAPADSVCNKTFLCTLVGNIPNINDAYVYYDCSSSGRDAERKVCAENEGFFNPCSGLCDSSLQKGPEYDQCSPSDPGSVVALLTNPSLYYVCASGQLFWNKCEKGYFDERVGACTGSSIYCDHCDLDEGGNNISKPSTSASTPTTNPGTPATPSPSACLGPTDRIADPTDPCWYYYCLASGGLERRRCDTGTIFEQLYRKCISSNGACT